MAEDKHWLLRWTAKDGGHDEESAATASDAEQRITRLLLDGVRPESIGLYESRQWNFEIAAHVKPGNATR